MDFIEVIRRWKRGFDNYVTYRRVLILLILMFCIILYLSPTVFHWFSQSPKQYQDAIDRCLEDRLTPFYIETLEFNANIRYLPEKEEDTSYLPFVGNGLFGVIISAESPIFIKSSRALSLKVPWQPIVDVDAGGRFREAIASRYLSGVSYRFQCFESGLHASYNYYAHRTLPFLFVQDLKIVNPSTFSTRISLSQRDQPQWPIVYSQTLKLHRGRSELQEYYVITGIVEDPTLKNEKVVGVSISRKVMPAFMKIGPHETKQFQILTAIYVEIIQKWQFGEKREALESKSLELLQKAENASPSALQEQHIDVWKKLWSTGVSISFSKAAGAINGDRINATLYYVLSSVRSFLHEYDATVEGKNELYESIENADGCYGGLQHTLQSQALNLWGSLTNADEVTKIISIWLLTLEKQGCHNLLKAGADGVMQAMVLSFGGFHFRPHHLELKIHPKFLHRDYFFRRINYGPQAHINVSITLQENNKAVLGVSLDRSDKTYYACDGGCTDKPVKLSSSVTNFPVKLTEPVTAILYVTTDKMHMELIKHTLHLHNIVEAPAHEHHIIALHRHGHHLGGLPTLFWASVSFLIIVFHLFLFKLIYNEYCGRQEKFRNRYGKL